MVLYSNYLNAQTASLSTDFLKTLPTLKLMLVYVSANEYLPRNLAAWYRVDSYIHVRTHSYMKLTQYFTFVFLDIWWALAVLSWLTLPGCLPGSGCFLFEQPKQLHRSLTRDTTVYASMKYWQVLVVPRQTTELPNLNLPIFLQWQFRAQLPNLISANISSYTVITILRLVTPKRTGTNGSKINDTGV